MVFKRKIQVILKIVNEEPPKLNKNEGWEETFVEMIESCLIKDPSKRLVIFEMKNC